MVRHKLATAPEPVAAPCHILAALFGDPNDMNRSHPVRLHESSGPMRFGARVIDVKFQVIGRRNVRSRIVSALVAIFWAAAIGFAVPHFWNLAQHVGVLFAER